MRDEDRDALRDLLPDWVAGRLAPGRADEVRQAVEADPDLRAEARVVRAVVAGRVEAPEGLAVRIAAAALRERRPVATATSRTGAAGRPRAGLRAPMWVMAAAAALVLVLGTLQIVDRTGGETAEDLEMLVTALEGRHTPWVADDGTVGGAAVLDGLSEEALAGLLEELGG